MAKGTAAANPNAFQGFSHPMFRGAMKSARILLYDS
jgi:hypothetical protein